MSEPNEIEAYLLRSARLRPPPSTPAGQRMKTAAAPLSEPVVVKDLLKDPRGANESTASDSTPPMIVLREPSEPMSRDDDDGVVDGSETPMAQILRLLHQPSTLQGAFLLGEVFRRPVERWDESW